MQLDYGKILKEERKARGITQAELAKGIGISQAQISMYESSTNEPGIEICIKIAQFYGITLDELFNLKENTKIYNNIHNNMNVTINQGVKK